ncbi:MAG TPA: LytTR family DNA-binding domain-containing protein [Chryseolinea sp.]|nr:LytTR family DNA-binding domain-containing protein [Chryseolinea sp.]HPM32614.1 LytTR family DNA-binding domain-containing protein [Chryseolinea sp.]
MKFQYIIVDDEPLARRLITSHASKIEGLELVGECGNAIEAINLLRNKPVELIFLDIQMPEVTGIQFVNTLKNPPSIIFTTAFRDFAPEAFELEAIDYLLKPISFERFVKSVNKFFDRKTVKIPAVSETREDAQDFLYIKVDRKIHKVLMSDVLYIESLDEYVKVHMLDKILITRENISTLEQKLSKNSFVRIHRSFIVSVRKVTSLSSDGVEIGKMLLPFGRAYKQSALTALGIQVK